MPIRPSSLGSREPDYSPGVSVGLVVVSLFNVHLPCDQFMFITNKHVDLTDWVHSSAWSRRRPSACDSLHRCRNFCFPGHFLSFHPHLLVHMTIFFCCRWLASALPAAWGAQTESPPGSNTEPPLLCKKIF